MSCISLIEFVENKLLHIDKQTWCDQLQDFGDNMIGEEKDASKKPGWKNSS